MHVPVLGATDAYIAPVMELVTGGNTTHYWEDSGIIGRLYDELLGFEGIYAWDIWFVYRAGVEWTGRLPPKPDFTMHQLGPLQSRFNLPFLDSKVFAAEVNKQLAHIGTPAQHLAARSRDTVPGTTIEKISQPAGVVVAQHIKGRSGYGNIKRIESIRIDGELTVGGASGSIMIEQSRPGDYRRTVRLDEQISVAATSGDSATFEGMRGALGLPDELEERLLSNFEFDGTLVDWKDKGHDLARRVHMEKLSGHLAWVLDIAKSNGSGWRLHIDSHGGHLLRQTLLNGQGEPLLAIEYGGHQESTANPLPQPFRLSSGTTLEHYVMPSWIAYRDAKGREISRIEISSVTIQTR